ncbi:MAG: N-acetylmuramic acid 6-phosphate etherase [Chloroflexi bacterium OLB15]|nr:MAG: N-acetylmuramic acid 6-phosphate etherase [Chloroflexi bacterium OLB15]
MLTEDRNPRSQLLDTLSSEDICRLMNAEDASVSAAVQAAIPAIAQAVDRIAEGMKAGGRLIYVGAGTSGRLAVLDAAECIPTFGIEPGIVIALMAGGADAFIRPVENAEDDALAGANELLALNLTPHDSVVGLAASGRTPYVLGAINAAREKGVLTVGISCNTPAVLLDKADIAIPLLVGPEILTGSTRLKAGTAQKMALNMLSTAVMIRLGLVYDNWMVGLRVTNQKLLNRARRIVADIIPTDLATAGQLLEAAGKDVRTAILMGRFQLNAGQATALLQSAEGNLRVALASANGLGTLGNTAP